MAARLRPELTALPHMVHTHSYIKGDNEGRDKTGKNGVEGRKERKRGKEKGDGHLNPIAKFCMLNCLTS